MSTTDMDHVDALIALQDATRKVRFGTLHVQALALIHFHGPEDPKATVIAFDMEGTPDEHIRDVELEAQRVASDRLSSLSGVEAVVVKTVGWQFTPCATCINREMNRGWGPRHNASGNCESGGRNHCTCKTCF